MTSTEPTVRHLPAAARIASPWKNGGGITREVAKSPASGDAFRWRVSIAEVSSAGPFSTFTGYRRWISVIDGPGMELRDASGGSTLLRPFHPHAFDGAEPIQGVLPFGPVSDLNLIFQPRSVRASMEFPQQARLLQSTPHRTVLVINVGKEPAAITAAGGIHRMDALDGLLATGGAVLELSAGQRCAVMEIDTLD